MKKWMLRVGAGTGISGALVVVGVALDACGDDLLVPSPLRPDASLRDAAAPDAPAIDAATNGSDADAGVDANDDGSYSRLLEAAAACIPFSDAAGICGVGTEPFWCPAGDVCTAYGVRQPECGSLAEWAAGGTGLRDLQCCGNIICAGIQGAPGGCGCTDPTISRCCN
jgi:hypothetical protein